jgi:uncharacterized coiled-coil protein SlyX
LLSKNAKTISVVTLGLGAALYSGSARADDISELKSLVNELKKQVVEQRAQINELNSQVNEQKKQVTTQSDTLQKVEAQQQDIAKKQAADAPVLAGDPAKPGFFKIPGTRTSLKFGGYVKLDAVDDLSGNIGSSAATDFGSIPLDHSRKGNRDGQVTFSAQETRLNLTALTATEALGDVKTYVEGDFYGSGNGGANVFRLRQAYVQGGRFLAGQTWTTFSDLDTAQPETLDFNGPVGYAATRQPLLRYTHPLPLGKLDLAIESPQGDFNATGSFNDSKIDKAPDLVARYTADTSWGHVGVAALGRYLATDSGLSGQSDGKFVYGVLAGLGIKTFGKDQLLFQTVDGNGVGRYLEHGQFISAIVTNDEIRPIDVWGGTVGYTHFWTDTLRSSAAYGYSHFSTPAGGTVQPLKSLTSFHANLIWSPWESTDVGLEYIYGHIELDRPQYDTATKTWASSGSANRIQASVKYGF